MKLLTNDRGLTLIELLAAIVIASMVGAVAYAVLFNGLHTYDRVKGEADLRDEADIIIAELISDLYTLKETEIESKHLPQSNSDNYFIALTSGEKIGFIDGKVYLKNGLSSSLQTGDIRLHEHSTIKEVEENGTVMDGEFEISLTLQWNKGDRKNVLTTKTVIGIIK